MSQSDNIIPIFFLDAVEMTFKSEQEGRPIFEDREFVRILIAGDNKAEHVREVRADDKERWADQYARFKRGLADTEQITGTPLSAWPIMKPSDIRMWNSVNVYTVEQLTTLNDTALQGYGMGARETQAKAKAFLAAAKDNAEATKHVAENDRLRAENAELKRDFAELAKRLEALEGAPAKRGPGRPPASAAA